MHGIMYVCACVCVCVYVFMYLLLSENEGESLVSLVSIVSERVFTDPDAQSVRSNLCMRRYRHTSHTAGPTNTLHGSWVYGSPQKAS